MRDIYRQAFIVIAWLGTEADGSDKALEILKVFGCYNLRVQDHTEAFMQSFRADLEFYNTGCWKAFTDFLCRPYWSHL
jgi:hypothetical protein